MKKICSLELPNEFRNVSEAYRFMRIFWDTFNQTKIEYEVEKSENNPGESSSVECSMRTFHIEVSIYERG